MSSFKFDATGIEELANEFEQMATSDLRATETEALKAGSEIVRQKQIANWNRSGADGEHIADNITIGRAYETKEGMGMSTGPKMSLRWRAKFVEYGTSYQPPQAPIDKSGQQSEGQVMNAMMNVFERLIRL